MSCESNGNYSLLDTRLMFDPVIAGILLGSITRMPFRKNKVLVFGKKITAGKVQALYCCTNTVADRSKNKSNCVNVIEMISSGRGERQQENQRFTG